MVQCNSQEIKCPFCLEKPCNLPWCPYTKEKNE
jgi:hypothetical protein